MRLIIFLSMFTIVCASVAAQRPTLTNDDLRLEKAARLAGREYVNGNDLIGRLDNTQSFQMHLQITEGAHVDATIEMLPASGNYRATFRRGVSGSKIETEQLIVVEPYYYRLASGATKWQTQVVNNDRRELSPVKNYVFMFFPWLLSAKLKFVETDQVEGTEALRYEISDYGGVSVAVKENPKVWVRASDGLPLKLLLNDKDGRPRHVITFSDFNEPLVISAPRM